MTCKKGGTYTRRRMTGIVIRQVYSCTRKWPVASSLVMKSNGERRGPDAAARRRRY